MCDIWTVSTIMCDIFPESGARAIRAVHVLLDLEELKTVSPKRLGACINIYGYVLHMYMDNIKQRIINEIR